jgi:hypothetical protein
VSTQRVVAVVVLLVLGIVSLPLVASVLDSEGTENWILPVQLLLMAAVGALVGWALPRLAGPAASKGRGAVVGAVVGVACGVLGLLVFFLLLNGISGA